MAKRALHPIPWLLFSAGGVASALFLPVLLFLFAVAFPLGWVEAPDHADLHGLVRSPLTILVVFGVMMLSLFHWAHRFRYTLYDGLQLHHLKRPIAVACYGGAVIGSGIAAYVLLAAR